MLFTENNLQLCSIYDWFVEDFGRNREELLEHLAGYAEEELAARLRAYNGSITYEYNWRLNDVTQSL